jgi:hypothetical protein
MDRDIRTFKTSRDLSRAFWFVRRKFMMKQTIKYTLAITFLIFVAFVVLAGCGRDTSWNIPETFRDSDLVGTWLLQTSELTETVALRDNGTFTQIFTSTLILGSRTILQQGTWSVEHRESGCIYVHLEKMLYLHGSADAILKAPSNVYTTLWENCEERLISIENKMTLVVAFFDKIALMLPPVHREGSASVKFERLAP